MMSSGTGGAEELSYPDQAGPLGVELLTLQINGEDGEVHRRVSRAVMGDVNPLTLRQLILNMVEALADTWGNDPEKWQAQLLELRSNGEDD